MSWWTYVNGTIVVRPMGRTQAEKRYILDTVLEHLPIVSGSEGDMNVYVIQKQGYGSSCSCDEFGQVTNNLRDRYGYRDRRNGWLRTQSEYILVVEASLRDREFDQTYKEFQKWLCRLSKRISVEDVLVEIKGYDQKVIIRNDNDVYGEMFESPSWYQGGMHSNWKLSKKLKEYSDNKEINEPNWCEYLLWESMDNCEYPRILGFKYFYDEENDRKVEEWMKREE